MTAVLVLCFLAAAPQMTAAATEALAARYASRPDVAP